MAGAYFRAFLIALGLWAGLGGAATAQSLTDALIAAYRNSPQLASNRAGLRSTDEGVAQARAGFRPSVSLDASSSMRYQVIPNILGNNTTYSNTMTLTADLTLWDGGNTALGVEIAKLQVALARQNLIDAEQKVFLDAATAFMDMRRDLQFLQLAEDNRNVTNRQVQAARDRFEVGEVRRTDVNQAEALLAAAQSTLALRQGNLEISRESYHLATGTYPARLQAPPSPPRIPSTLDGAISVGKRSHPSVQRAQLLVKIAHMNVARAEAMMKPRLSARGALGINADASTGDTLSLSLNGHVPIYQGGTLISTLRSARALEAQAIADVQLAGLAVQNSITRSWALLKISRASITARQKQIRASRVALRGISEEANLGARTTLDVLNAELDLMEAETNLFTARRDEYVAIYSLLSSMGLLTANHLGLGIATYDPEKHYEKVKNAPPPTASERSKILRNILKRAGRD